MKGAAALLVGAYGLMLLLVGIAGIFSAGWELQTFYALDYGTRPGAETTFLSQYRFLKGVELGAGAFCLIFVQDILAGGRAALAFLLVIGGGIAGRAIGWLADGLPAWPMLVFLGLELVVLAVFILYRRLAHG